MHNFCKKNTYFFYKNIIIHDIFFYENIIIYISLHSTMKYKLLFVLIIIIVVLFFINNLNCIKNSSILKLNNQIKNNNHNIVLCYNYDLRYFNNQSVFLSHKKNFLISNKKYLWNTLKKYYGENIAKIITPMTYSIPEDYKKYKKEAVGKKIIFKENTHHQEGLFITENIQDLNFLLKQKLIVGQEFIKDTLKYNNYKLSFRIYLILGYVNNVLEDYIYDDGLVYYGKNDIASFYDSFEIYKTNPIIISELEKIINVNIRALLTPKIKLLINAIKKTFV